jgi:hypothetical protein
MTLILRAFNIMTLNIINTQHKGIKHNDTQYKGIEHNDTEQNNTQHKNTQHDDIQHNGIQRNETQHNDTWHNGIQHMILSILCLIEPLSIRGTQHTDTRVQASYNLRGC